MLHVQVYLMIILKSPKQIDQIVNVTLDSEKVIYNTYVYIFIIKDLQPILE